MKLLWYLDRLTLFAEAGAAVRLYELRPSNPCTGTDSGSLVGNALHAYPEPALE